MTIRWTSRWFTTGSRRCTRAGSILSIPSVGRLYWVHRVRVSPSASSIPSSVSTLPRGSLWWCMTLSFQHWPRRYSISIARIWNWKNCLKTADLESWTSPMWNTPIVSIRFSANTFLTCRQHLKRQLPCWLPWTREAVKRKAVRKRFLPTRQRTFWRPSSTSLSIFIRSDSRTARN